MTNEIRKSYRKLLEELKKVRFSLEALNTKENQEVLLKYPAKDGEWRHPLSHLIERTNSFLENAEKCISKIVEALPRERKSKPVKKVDWDGKNNEKSKEGARSSKKNRDAGESSGDRKLKSGSTGDASKPSGGKPRKPRSDKGKSRKA